MFFCPSGAATGQRGAGSGRSCPAASRDRLGTVLCGDPRSFVIMSARCPTELIYGTSCDSEGPCRQFSEGGAGLRPQKRVIAFLGEALEGSWV